MTVKLPKKGECSRADAQKIVKQLKSLLAYSATSASTYEFYDVVDQWLGPWGDSGYPIGYGKKYNIKFNANTTLNSPDRPISALWVRQTTLNLQLAIIDYIEARIKNGTLASVDDKSMRLYAFNSHPKAYLDAGLQAVAANEITSLPVIALIPWREFNPLSAGFSATFRQVYHVIKDPGILSWLIALDSGKTKWERTAVQTMVGEASKYVDEVIADAKHELDYFFR